MRKLTTFAMALLMGMMMLVSCNKDKENKVVFTASIESPDQGRTTLNPENGQVKWKAGDKIMIANGNGETAVFTLQSGANTTNGTFTYAGEFDMVPPFTAFYPYTAEYYEEGWFGFEVPAVQHLTETGTFANGANPMMAYGTNDNLYFKNVCGGLGIRLYGNGVHVTKISISGVSSEQLNGLYEVGYEEEDADPVMYDADGDYTNTTELTCDVMLMNNEVTEFFAVLPVGALNDGVIVDVYDGDAKIGGLVLPEGHWAKVERGTIKCFQPIELTITDNHEGVDLGLPSGLLWATCNVGAESPEDYGDYIAWGETYPKDTYDWSSYLLGWDWNHLSSYNTDPAYGWVDNLTVLQPQNDAATENWSYGWRTPTKEEWEELYNNTTVTWTQQNGVNGRLFTANNGNSIFLPAAGDRYGTSVYGVGSHGYYWSSSLRTDDPDSAWYLYFGSGNYYMNYLSRYCGHSVRPVRSASQN